MSTSVAASGDVRPNQREHILDMALRLMSERGATGMIPEDELEPVDDPTVQPVGRSLLDLLGPAARDWIVRFLPELERPDEVARLLVGQLLTGFVRTVFEPELDPQDIIDGSVEALSVVLR